MNYKRIIKNKNTRFLLLKILDFIPDILMIKIQYIISTNRTLNLKNPARFTEKIQWYKLYYREPLLTKCSDKFNVRDFVSKKGLSEILIPLYGVFNDFNDINFEDFPESFVLKTTNGSHTNLICTNKSDLNLDVVKKEVNSWLSSWSSKMGREWGYYNIKPKLICEKLLEKDDNNDLIDYKFFCFNGVPYCMYAVVDRYTGKGLKLGIFDTDFKLLPYKRSDIKGLKEKISKPENFDRMLEISKILSSDFPFVRVDLYNIKGVIYFGELTFYDGSGYKGFAPDTFDFILGDQFDLPQIQL
jgi:hypothetical protein